MTRPANLPLRKKAGFSLLSLVLFFTLLELILAGWGMDPVTYKEDPFVGFSGNLPLYVPDPANPGMLVTADSKRTHFNVQRFAARKPSNTLRVFCLGGSTTYGRPFHDVTSFPGWLREFLPVADPEHSWEVINAGGISYASYRIASLVKELLELQPDLFIVYTGHNEFLEKRTYPQLSQMSPWIMKTAGQASRLRTYTLLRNCFTSTSTPAHSPYRMSNEVDEILNHTVGPSSYHRDDTWQQQVFRHFEYNLQRIIHLARSRGIEVLLVTPASNLKDCAPFKSQHREGLAIRDQERFDQYLDRARQFQAQGKTDLAMVQYHNALEIDPRHAQGQYQASRLLLKQEQASQALEAAERARDEDICPLRAPKAIQQICQRLATSHQVPLVDFVALLQQRSLLEHQHGIPGQEHFLDHVHLRPKVHRQLAIDIVDELIQSGFISNHQAWQQRDLESIDREVYARVSPSDQAIALRNVAKVLNWAGKHLEAGALAMQALETLPRDPESLLLSAPYLKTLGRIDEAIAHYQAALQQLPDHIDGHQLLGALLAENGAYREAKQHFLEILRLRPEDWQAALRVAILATELKQFDEALRHYQSLVQRVPGNAMVHYHYGSALAHAGNLPAAIQQYQQTISLDPRHADAYFNLATLLEASNISSARQHYKQALKLRPGFPAAQERLQQLAEKTPSSTAEP